VTTFSNDSSDSGYGGRIARLVGGEDRHDDNLKTL
jgi:hypothetical protein